VPVTTTRLSPNMDWQTAISAINQNFQALESLAKTSVYKDETGVNRIIIGRMPDGTWGIIVSKEGVDVLDLFKP
jgi:hypothetical protein